MKILHVIDTLEAGGKERQLLALLKGIENRRSPQADVVILSDRIDYEQIGALAHRVHIFRRRFRKDPFVFFQLMKLVRELRPDVIHSWELMCSIYAIPAAWRFGVPLIHGVVRNAPADFRVFSLSGALFYLSCLLSDVTLCNSLAGQRAYKVPPGKAIVILNGFDDARLDKRAEPGAIRRRLNLDDNPVIGMTANFTPVKDHRTVIDAGLKLLERDPGLNFVFIGDGPEMDHAKRLVPRAMKKRFKFAGKRADVESICQLFDVGLLASFEDGTSNAIMEYMALGKPVIAYRCGGNGEIVIDGVSGYLVEPRNSSELAQKVRYLLDRPELARNMGHAGRLRLKRCFSLDAMVGRTLQLYGRLVGKKKK